MEWGKERIQKRALKILCPGKTYRHALIECGLETLENRRENMCVKLIEDMTEPMHKLNGLLPPMVGDVREETHET